MKRLNLFLLFCTVFKSTEADELVEPGPAICRNDANLKPHMSELWEEGFPASNDLNLALCEGTMNATRTGEICVDGRVNYVQLIEFIDSRIPGRNIIPVPAAPTISVTGHLASGSGNLVLGPEAYFLYDYVTSYVVNETTYFASDGNIVDNLLAASMGTIDGVCFNSSIVQPESYYEIVPTGWRARNVNIEEYANSNLIFGSKAWVAGETHITLDAEPSIRELVNGALRQNAFLNIASISIPDFLYNVFPIFQFTGILRRAVIGNAKFSTFSTPQPLISPDAAVENSQLDIPWSTMLLLVEDKFYSWLPGKMGTVVKKVVPSSNPNGCWDVPVASIDFQMPLGFGEDIDTFLTETLWPKLLEQDSNPELTFHFGKRVPAGSAILQAALDKYESCGANLSPVVEKCYHPLCTRSTTPTAFEYPEKYYS